MSRSLILVLVASLALAACNARSPEVVATAATATMNAPGAGSVASSNAGATPEAAPWLRPGEIVAGSCDSQSDDSQCGEITVKTEDDKASARATLQKFCPGTVVPAPCTASARVGVCRLAGDTIFHYYPSGPKRYTADSAKKDCERIRAQWVTP